MSEQPPQHPWYRPPPTPPPTPPPPLPGVVPLAPLDLGDLLGGVLKAWWRHWRVVVPLSVGVSVLTALAGLPAMREFYLVLPGPSAPPAQAFDRFLASVPDLVGLSAVYIVVSLAATAFVWSACAVVGLHAVLGKDLSWAGLWARVRPQLLRACVLTVAVFGLSWLGLLFCIVPGIVLFTLWVLAFPALVVERLTVAQAMRRSFRLVTADGWRVFAILALVTVASVAAASVLTVPLGTAVELTSPATLAAGSPQSWTVPAASSAAGLVAGALTVAVLPLTSLLLYVDQRVRQERYDLALAHEAAAPPA